MRSSARSRSRHVDQHQPRVHQVEVPRAAADPARCRGAAPRGLRRRGRGRSMMRVSRSVHSTRPAGPTRSASQRATLPPPPPTSRQCQPARDAGRTPARAAWSDRTGAPARPCGYRPFRWHCRVDRSIRRTWSILREFGVPVRAASGSSETTRQHGGDHGHQCHGVRELERRRGARHHVARAAWWRAPRTAPARGRRRSSRSSRPCRAGAAETPAAGSCPRSCTARRPPGHHSTAYLKDSCVMQCRPEEHEGKQRRARPQTSSAAWGGAPRTTPPGRRTASGR